MSVRKVSLKWFAEQINGQSVNLWLGDEEKNKEKKVGDFRAYCCVCDSSFSIKSGWSEVKKHGEGPKHIEKLTKMLQNRNTSYNDTFLVLFL